MDVAALTAFLAPFLPYLFKAGETTAEEAGKAIGEGAWAAAKGLWERLWPHVEEQPGAQAAAERVAKAPDDDRVRGALEVEIEDLLKADASLKTDIERLWADAKAANVVTASGDRSIAIGGDARGIFITGDDATIS